MTDYSDFIVGLWLVPVVLCIVTPLAVLCLWCVKRILIDTSVLLARMKRVVSQESTLTAGDARPLARA